MPRMSRVESQARTRETLVATATELFLQDGYAATSLEKVADEAGFSKGAVYSNFRNKDELCLAVVDAIRADQAHKMASALEGAATLEAMLTAFERWADETIGDQAWTVFEVEFATRARQDEVVRRELALRNAQIRAAVTLLLTAHAEEFGIVLPMPAEDCATALLSLGVGLGVQRAIDPEVGIDVLAGVIRLLAGGASQAGRLT
ncbi:TetR/AcrR family transcriptional regulator [Streptomyces sp. SID13031]|uniref:TetR/AcrR family transcriptional regulator n=1 Tax=Streptomyces sp. SID13031 TaxID=2706046 RepID=UPI0013CB1307|nr:TetR/AcrR family transcriptional regulator [Streptomyces sp. SID13031]NEA33442.1 TetR/AcrR family transcriptional regulator [Streptomyces sp. SID13031]